MTLQQRAGLVAVEPWHHQIQENYIGSLTLDHTKSREAIGRGQYHRATRVQYPLHRASDGFAIVND